MTYNVSSGTLNLYTTTTVSVMSCQQGVIATLVFLLIFAIEFSRPVFRQPCFTLTPADPQHRTCIT